MTNRERLNLMRDALGLLSDASRKVEQLDGWALSARVRSLIATAVDDLETCEIKIQRDMNERSKRFNAVPVLQAELRFIDGKTRRVAVSKPTDEIDDPYIGEMFHAALVKQGVVASLEDYPILVVDKRGRIVGEIPLSK